MDVRGRRFCQFFFCCALLVSARGHALELNGVASFSELGEEVYLAGLYTDWRSTDPAVFFNDARERRMEVRFSSSMSRRRWANSWMQSIAINNSREHLEEAAGELSYVLSTFEGNLYRGDHVEIHYIPGEGTELRVNGHVLASGHSVQVFNLFLSSWIGPVPPSSQFRSTLLGQEESSERTRFVTSQPALDRIDAVGSWTAVTGAAAVTAPVPEEEDPVTETAGVEPAVVETRLGPEVPPPVIALPSLAGETEVPATPAIEPVAAAPDTLAVSVEAEIASAQAPMEERVAAVEEVAQDEFFDDDDGELDLSVAAILGQRDYMSQLIRDVYSNIRYPERAVRRNYEGSVRMRLIIGRDGSLADMQVMEGARYGMLNEEAERAVLAATPFAPIPSELRGDRIEVELPINFRLE